MPDQTVAAAAAHLTELGLVEVARVSFVRCSSSRDPDYPPPVRDCPGRIRLLSDGDRGICPECGRDVDLSDPEKRRYEGLEIHVQNEGVMAYIAGATEEFGAPVRAEAGLLRFRSEPADIFVYVPELCRDEHRRRRDAAATDPTVVVTLEPSGPARVLPEPWLIRTTLADLVTGQADLKQLLHAAASQGRPTTLLNASVPIYAGGVRPIIARSPEAPPLRRFVVQIGHHQARVEGVLIASRKARAQLIVLQILAKPFMRSLMNMSDTLPGPLSAGKIADRLQRLTRKPQDHESVRKSINRLQDTITHRIKRTLGLSIGREDIIQTVAWQGEDVPYGYQLHPRNVLIGHAAGYGAQVSEEFSNGPSVGG